MANVRNRVAGALLAAVLSLVGSWQALAQPAPSAEFHLPDGTNVVGQLSICYSPAAVTTSNPLGFAVCTSGGSGNSSGNIGTVPTPDIAGASATSGDPAYTAGGQALSEDLSGHLRVTLDGVSVSLGAGSATIGAVTQAGGTPSPCTASTVGTSATLILDSVANGTGRAGGGYVLLATATAPIEYQWSNSSTGLTTTPGGIVYQLPVGGTIPFAGAPNSQLYAISTASQTGSCQYTK